MSKSNDFDLFCLENLTGQVIKLGVGRGARTLMPNPGGTIATVSYSHKAIGFMRHHDVQIIGNQKVIIHGVPLDEATPILVNRIVWKELERQGRPNTYMVDKGESAIRSPHGRILAYTRLLCTEYVSPEECAERQRKRVAAQTFSQV